MLINTKKIINIMEEIAPSHIAESWDNVGLLLGDEDRQINRILVALEVTDDIVLEAINESVDLIITHHPIFFGTIKSLTTNNSLGRKIHKLIEHKISVYTAHTNLDIAVGGTSDLLANVLELKGIGGLSPVSENNYLGRVGYLKQSISLMTLANNLSNILETKLIKVVGDIEKQISKVGLCTGSGMDFVNDAIKMNCDVYITGDIKYHQAQIAKEDGMCLIDVGHFASEVFSIKPLAKRLRQICELKDYDVDIIVANNASDPFICLNI